MSTKKEVRTYRQIKSELDAVLLWFESEDIDVDEAIEKYKHARKLTKELETYLKNAENSITKLT